jgi:septal ring factor EnvC (AmiA/AmiB activator)
MLIEINVSLIIAICSIFGTLITAITFFNKLRWDNAKQDEELSKHLKEIEKLKQKLDGSKESQQIETKQILLRIDAVEKSMVEISTTLNYVQDTVREIKEKLNND